MTALTQLLRRSRKTVIKTQAIDFKDVLLKAMDAQEVFIKLLVRNGTITKKKLLEEIKTLKDRGFDFRLTKVGFCGSIRMPFE